MGKPTLRGIGEKACASLFTLNKGKATNMIVKGFMDISGFLSHSNRHYFLEAVFITLLTFSAASIAQASPGVLKQGAIKNTEKTAIKTLKLKKYRRAPKNKVIDGQYIIVLKDTAIKQEIEKITQQSFSALSTHTVKRHRQQALRNLSQKFSGNYGAVITQQYDSVINGYAAKLADWEVENMLLLEDNIAYIEQDQKVKASEIQFNATPGLDRIDQQDLPLNGEYAFTLSGKGVDVWIIDTGILSSHQDFSGRVDTRRSFSAINDGFGSSDCDGHGTHVAGTVGSDTFGVAKEVNLIAVRVLDCQGEGSMSDVIAGVNFVTQNAQGPSVANMSLGGGLSQALDDAIQNSINAGITYIVAAGNENTNACNGSPARLRDAITVASSTVEDRRSGFSNFGSCVDIFAPGSDITSTYSNGGFATFSGTSMAAPHVAGVAALALELKPNATPSEVFARIQSAAVTNRLEDINGSPNLLLQANIGEAPLPSPTPAPQPNPMPENCFYRASFESSTEGWTQNNSTCETGNFAQGKPNPTGQGELALQPDGAAAGNAAWFTQANSSLGVNDVDGGSCVSQSPIIETGTAENLAISLMYFHGQRDAGDDADDGLTIEVLNNGEVVETLVKHGDETLAAQWTPLNTVISNPGNIQLQVTASDGRAAGDIIEAGIDEVLICAAEASPELPNEPECEFVESFENGGGGWQISQQSTCRTGNYVIGEPSQQVNNSTVTQVGGAAHGRNAVFTAANSSAGTHDVDGGNCIATSPIYSVTEDARLSLAYFHGQRDTGDDPNDFFRLELSTDGGINFTTLESHGDTRSNAVWRNVGTAVSAGDNVVLRLQCADGSFAGDLVECGIDNLKICRNR